MTGRLQTGALLTPRERDVLLWTAAGKTTRDIAAILGISKHTVAEHAKRVRFKLGTCNTAHSIVCAIKLGEIDLTSIA